MGYNTDKLEELLLLLLKKPRVRENPFRYPVISSNKEDIPRDTKKKDKGKAIKWEDKYKGSNTKKKGKEREESLDKKKKRDESLISIDIRRSPRKKPI